MSDLYKPPPLTEQQWAVMRLLLLPDPPTLCNNDGVGRGHHYTQEADKLKRRKFTRWLRRAWISRRVMEKYPEELPSPAKLGGKGAENSFNISGVSPGKRHCS